MVRHGRRLGPLGIEDRRGGRIPRHRTPCDGGELRPVHDRCGRVRARPGAGHEVALIRPGGRSGRPERPAQELVSGTRPVGIRGCPLLVLNGADRGQAQPLAGVAQGAVVERLALSRVHEAHRVGDLSGRADEADLGSVGVELGTCASIPCRHLGVAIWRVCWRGGRIAVRGGDGIDIGPFALVLCDARYGTQRRDAEERLRRVPRLEVQHLHGTCCVSCLGVDGEVVVLGEVPSYLIGR